MSKLVTRIGVPALAVLVLAGCGSSQQHELDGELTTSTPTPSSLERRRSPHRCRRRSRPRAR